MGPSRTGDLEIDVDAPFTRFMWRLQRAGWLALSAVIVAGALGVFGDGVLARRTAEAGGGALRVEYERFVRRLGPTEIRIRARASGGTLRVWIDREYLESFELRAITPQPVEQRVGAARCELDFELAEGADVGEFVLDLEPRGAGSLAGRIGCGSAEIAIEQFAYP